MGPESKHDGMGSSQVFGSARAFGSPLREPEVVPETQPEVEEMQKGNPKPPHKKKTETRAKKCATVGCRRVVCVNPSFDRRVGGPPNRYFFLFLY
ncbi:hypothetical protein Hanom_Chr05g00465611 [Helianthus anomalus]